MGMFSSAIGSAWRKIFRESVRFFRKDAQLQLGRDLRQIGCLDQAQLMRYIFFANSKEQVLANELKNANRQLTGRLESVFQDYRDFLNQELRSAVIKHLRWAQGIFQGTLGRSHFAKPRCGVKTIEGSSSSNSEIVSLWGTEGYSGRRCKLTNNSAAYEVFRSPRTVCIVNDIPRQVVRKKEPIYRNDRINVKLANDYYCPIKFWEHYPRRFRILPDEDWRQCWNTEQCGAPVPQNTIYKSTLVVPITLNFDTIPDLQNEFIAQWSNLASWALRPGDIPGHNISDNLACFGYFCVDTHIIDYFDELLDQELGYFIADLLYFYFLAYHMHTRLSPVYADYCRLKEDAQKDGNPLHETPKPDMF